MDILIVNNVKECDCMDLQRAFEIVKNKQKRDVFFEERPVWIQEVRDNKAKIGFVDNFEEKDVYIEDLYESDLYN